MSVDLFAIVELVTDRRSPRQDQSRLNSVAIALFGVFQRMILFKVQLVQRNARSSVSRPKMSLF
jgi:hypothetical protein